MASDAQQDWVARVLGVAAGPHEPLPAVDEAASLRLSRLQARFPGAVHANPDERSRLTAMMAMANELVMSGDTRAAGVMDRLEKALGAPAGVEAAPKLPVSRQSIYELVGGDGQLVEYRKALLAWNTARRSAQDQIKALKSEIGAAAPALADAAGVVDGVMARFGDDLGNAIDDAMTATDLGARTQHHHHAAEIARAYLMQVNFDPVFKTVDTNPVRTVSLRGTLGDALSKVIAAIPA